MKTITALFLLFVLPFAAISQTNPVDRLFDKYAGKEGFTSVYISSQMFSLLSGMSKGDKDYDDTFGKLTGIRILTSDREMPGLNFYNEIMRDLPLELYEELMVIHEKDQNIKFLVNEKDGIINELLMVVGGSDDNVLISIRGQIDLKTISGLSESMKIKGLDKLEKVDRQ